MIGETVVTLDNPFPGLRPFQFEESRLFFGREGLSQELLERLSESRFLAVVGSSGSGKSSLVRAGLLPVLFGGFMAEAGSDWRIAVMRPGNGPINELARVLNEPDVLGLTIDDNEETQRIIIDEALGRGSKGLVEIVRQAGLIGRDENLLLVVDQFEELFRYASHSINPQLLEHTVVSAGEPVSELRASNNGKGLRNWQAEKYEDEAAAFVQLLLEATQQNKVPIFVVITMRSDYFGNCAQFWGLPEAINEGQYLIPRLTREQQRLAITKPIEIFGAEISPRLVSQLLNDMGEDSDQLPLLQHALMRTWKNAGLDSNGKKVLDLDHYLAIGGMAGALSNHAESAFTNLSDEHKEIAEKLFKCLTVKGPEGQEIRRPTILKTICEIIAEDEQDVIEVIEVFRRRGRSFLMPPVNEPLKAASQIDISHESLIRCWHRLSNWVDEESQAASRYRRLADTAMLHEEKRAEMLRGSDAHYALEWYEKTKPNEAWAKRYHCASFDIVMAFLKKSKELHEQELQAEEMQRRKEIRRKFVRILKPTLTIASVLLVVASIVAVYNWRKASRESAAAGENFREAQRQGAAAEHRGYAAHMAVAQTFYNQGDFAAANAKLNWISSHIQSGLKQNLNDFAGFEWYHLLRLSQNEDATLPGPSEIPVGSVAFDPANNLRIVGGAEDGAVRIWIKVNGLWLRQEDLKVSPNFGITSIAFSPSDEGLLATASRDGKVRLCDLRTRQVKPLDQKNPELISTTVAFSPDGKRLAAGGVTRTDRPVMPPDKEEGTVSLWQIASRSAQRPRSVQIRSSSVPIYTTNTSMEQFIVNAIAFSPEDGRVVAIGTNEGVKLLDRGNNENLDNETFKQRPPSEELHIRERPPSEEMPIREPTAGKNISVNSVAFSPLKKNLLAIGCSDSKVRLWDSRSKELTELDVHSKEVSSVAFSDDGKRLATGSYDGSVKLWDTSPDGLVLIKKLARVSPRNLPLKPTLKGHAGHVKSVAFFPDGQTLVTGSKDGTTKLWDVTKRLQDISEREDPGVTLKIHDNAILSLAYFPAGKWLVSGSADRSFRWTSIGDIFEKRRTGRDPKTIKQAINDNSTPEPSASEVSSVTVSGNGKMLAEGNWSGNLRLWELDRGEPRKKRELPPLQQPDQQGRILSISFSPNETMLAASLVNNDRENVRETVRVWQLESPRLEPISIKGGAFIAFSPTDSGLLATGGFDKIVRLWKVEPAGLSEIRSGVGHTKQILCVAFSPDGKLLATGSADNTVILWKVDTLESVAILMGHSNAISSLAFSSRSDRLATGSYDGSVKLWDTSPQMWRWASQPLELTTLQILSAPLALTFSPDTRTLVAGGANGHLWLWRAEERSGDAQ
jgi:WD40 repeat protein